MAGRGNQSIRGQQDDAAVKGWYTAGNLLREVKVEDDERNTTAVNYAPEMVLVVFRRAGVETPC